MSIFLKIYLDKRDNHAIIGEPQRSIVAMQLAL